MERATLTVEEVGEVLGIGRSAAYAAVRRGEIPTIKIGRRYLVSKVALNKFLSGELHPPSTEPSLIEYNKVG